MEVGEILGILFIGEVISLSFILKLLMNELEHVKGIVAGVIFNAILWKGFYNLVCFIQDTKVGGVSQSMGAVDWK